MNRVLLAVALSPLLLAVACKGPQLSGKGEIARPLPEAPAPQSLSAAEAYPFLAPDHSGPTPLERVEPGEDGHDRFVTRYAIVDGLNAGEELRVERTPAEQEGAWRLRWFRVAGGARTLIDEKVVALVEGQGAVLTGSIDHAEGVVVEFDPPLTLIPTTLTPASPFRQEAAMRLPLIEKPEQLREKGKGVSTLNVAASQPIQAGGSKFDAARLHEVFESDLSMADATRTTDHWFAPGVGLVARRWHEKVKALGLIVKDRAQEFVVIPP